MSLIPSLLEHLSGAPTEQIGRTLGLDKRATSSAITSVLPVILGGLANNTQQGNGAGALSSALDRDHDGSILDDLAGYVNGGSTQIGDGILGHIFGGQRSQAEAAVESKTSLSSSQVTQLMALLAPIVMGYLGKRKREQSLDAGGLARELDQESQSHGPQGASLGGMVSKMLDRDGDGSAMDDVLRIGGGFLSSWTS